MQAAQTNQASQAKQSSQANQASFDTQCPFCSVQCKMRVIEERHTDRRPTYKIEGLPNAASEGRLCVKGINAYQHALSRERLLMPLLKTDGAFREISWEEALNIVADRFSAIQAERGADAVGLYGGGSLTNESAYVLGKFARVALGTRYIDYNGRFCMSAAASAGVKTFGLDRGLTNPLSEVTQTECIVLAGTNIAECQPTLMPYFTKAKENGARIIVIDPRKTKTAEMADIHLKVKPGTDLALANGLLKVIVEEKLTNAPFIASRTSGFEDVLSYVSSLDLADIASLTGVDEEDIRQAARAFGKAATGMIFTARGVEQHRDGHMAVRAFLNLILATGKIGKPGCGYGAVTGQGNGQGGREHGQKADQLPGYRLIENPEDRAYVASVWGVDPADLPGKGVSAYEMMEFVHKRDIRALLVMSSNPVVSNPNADFVAEGLRRLDFLVVADLFLSETALMADLVLPATAFMENEGTLTNLEGRVLLRGGDRPAPGEARHDWRILSDLAARLGKDAYFPYSTAEQIFEELRLASKGGAADYYGITYERIRKEGGVYWPCSDPEGPGTARLFERKFAHPDGKAAFAKAVHDVPGETEDEAYPLVMTNGRMLSHYLTGVQTRRSPTLLARELENVIEIHPRTAERYRIGDGELVRVASRRGSMIVRSRLTADIREDTVFVPMHWGGVQNVNNATNPLLDPFCKMPDFKTSAVRIRALNASDLAALNEAEG
ncbi:molybdopterin oxidoreductase family protein [Cohnella sp. GbtcB17]|uniref:assimilatory nitrate reductase catalytic subunit NasC n=1 Tax=Cohnella sp. GbtcB17 TaxID=2824762 RepID=UPI001C304939|nr:nitrate reductase [Cohnella sp. GbtcB17]